MQTWHITNKRLVGRDCCNDVFEGTDVEVCDHEGGCKYSNDGNDNDSAHGIDQDVAQDDQPGADGKCKASNVDADSMNMASADGKAEDSKDDDGIDKKADNGKDKITNLDAVDSVMIDEVKDGNAPAHADLGGKNKDSADDKDDDVVSDGDSAILDELKFVVL